MRRVHAVSFDRAGARERGARVTILVGPGSYEPDLDADGVREPGDDPIEIRIDEAVQLVSRFGASSTLVRSTVVLEASGARLGARTAASRSRPTATRR